MPISVLDEETINKIAAGEVIERPSNVVKELVENSLDAGSKKIEIEIKGAGRQLIRVRDDGSGMAEKDISLALTRHATSKISNFSDLEKINSLGFRGEALPSIASVSYMLIQSQLHSQNSGWEISFAGGKLKESRAWAGASGTNIEIAQLFFNTPARAKFLKSDTTERHRIIHLLEEMAMAWPQTAFHVVSEGRVVLNAPKAKNLEERITDVLGKDFSGTLMPVNAEHQYIKINAYITKKENSLASKNSQFLYVNKRPINFSRAFMHSLYEAYKENMPVGRHPGVVIYIDIDPSEIDINIHPTKREIRFSKEQEIYHFLYRTIKNALSQTAINYVINTPKENFEPKQQYIYDNNKPDILDTQKKFNYSDLNEPRKSYNTEQIIKSNIFKPLLKDMPKQEDFTNYAESGKSLKFFGQAFGMYLLAQQENNFLIIDQHAAAERIRYEKYLKQWQEKQISIQPLLFPITIEFSPSQAGLLKENLKLLQDAGWEIEEFGSNTVRITALPSVLGSNSEARNMLNEIIQALINESKMPLIQKAEKIIKAACHASIKAGDYISNNETSRLVNDLFLCSSPYTCPHGRPTIFKITFGELEKFFGRK